MDSSSGRLLAGPIRVETRSSHRGDTRPLRVHVGDEVLVVAAILGSRFETEPAAGSATFKVFTLELEDGRQMTLEHEPSRDIWRIRP